MIYGLICQTLLSALQAPVAVPDTVTMFSVCDLRDWDDSKEGQILQIRGILDTDYFHYDGLSDAACSKFSISLDLSSDSDQSVNLLYERLSTLSARNNDARVWVTLVATYHWLPGRVVNADLPKYKQLKIEPHGVLSVVKLVDFGEVGRSESLRRDESEGASHLSDKNPKRRKGDGGN